MVFLLLLGTRYLMPLCSPRRPVSPGFAALAIDARPAPAVQGYYFE
jgi:hypothetical protein